MVIFLLCPGYLFAKNQADVHGLEAEAGRLMKEYRVASAYYDRLFRCRQRSLVE
jgi:hypothetical protein